jgi:hypothetical protein
LAQPHMQYSFHAGEWAPALNARVDEAKYHSAAALMRNFYVDYRGGASSCPGTKYCLQAKSIGAWLIPFQASFTVSYMLEFGQNYIRFYQNGSPVLEAAQTITALTNANPGVFTEVAHGYSIGDWVYLLVTGTSGLNGKYFIVNTTPTVNTFTLTDLFGNVVNTTASGAFVSGTSQRVFTLPSPYNVADLPLLKYAQSVQILILTNANYVPYVLTFISPTNWTLNPITFGSTITPPTNVVLTSTQSNSGPFSYSYVVTAVDKNGQESGPSAVVNLNGYAGALGNTNLLSWNTVPGAIFYNVYSTGLGEKNHQAPTGAAFGFIGFCTGTNFSDTFTALDTPTVPDYQTTPPIPQNPFQGAGVDHAIVTVPGVYTSVPTVSFAAAPAGGQTANGVAILQLITVSIFASSGAGHTVGQAISFGRGVVLIVAAVSFGVVTAFQPLNYPGTSPGSISSGNAPASLSNNAGTISIAVTWGVGQVNVNSAGAGYLTVPPITFSAGAAAATAVLQPSSFGNPAVPAFYQQRLVLGGPPGSPQTFYMSRPGSYYNYDKSNPTQSDDAITGTIVSKQLNAIKSMVAMPGGLIMMSSAAAWQINGGSAGAAITPVDANAQAQSYVGASDLPLIVSNYDVLFVQAKGSIVRDMSYNFYANVWTGTDVSILSSHLFYSYSLLQWAWAEEPFKVVWAVRNDGILLSLTYLKEQELIGWAHRDTLGLFTSVGTITESTATAGNVDAVYVIVQRIIQGQVLQYVERMSERAFPYGMEDAWCVDAALQSTGQTPAAGLTASQSGVGAGVTFTADASVFTAPMVGWVIRMGGGIATITGFTDGQHVTATIMQAISSVLPDSGGVPLIAASGAWTLWTPFTAFGGLDHLNGQSVVGLADGVPIGPLTVTSGSVTLPNPATKVVLGLAFTPQLQTLQLDLGEPTIQGKRKKIVAVTARVKDSLGLSIGQSFSTLVPMKDLVLGNVGSATNTKVTNLVTADARTLIDPLWQVPGQYCFQQNFPLPVSILGVIPETAVGDTR